MKWTASPIAMSYDGTRNEYIDQSNEKFIKAMAVAGAVFESAAA